MVLDAVLDDSRLAARIFGVAVLCLMATASVGLNGWPAQSIFGAFQQGTGVAFIRAFQGHALILLILFWASRPSRRSQWVAFVVGATLAVLLWHRFDAELHFTWTGGDGFPGPMLGATALAIPAGALLVWRIVRVREASASLFDRRLLWLVVLTGLFIAVPRSALGLATSLHPATFDLFALHWDRAAGLNFAPQLITFVDEAPGVSQLLHMAYGLTPLAMLSVALLQLRGRPRGVASAMLAWVVLTTCAFVAYNFFPITGPKYVFTSDQFAAMLRDSASHPIDQILVGPYPRNGMPSMHFGWTLAAAILWWRTGTRLASRVIVVGLSACTAAATLYNGEHYVVDLIVAVPFVMGAIALSTTDLPWTHAGRRNTAISGLATWLLWVLLLRTQVVAFVESPWLCWVLVATTAIVVWLQARWMSGFNDSGAIDHLQPTPESGAATKEARSLQWRFGAMFFVSGMAALTYQVLFAKELALVFGSTAAATFTVLATFLGGMALGSLVGGQWAHRLPRPLRAYALVEIGIAVYCVATPLLFDAIQSGYVAVASGQPPDAPHLMVLRVLLGAAVLLVPTVLMGATLPVLVQAAGPSLGRIGERVAWLYFTNTAGAALGALLTAYFIIPSVGAHRTTLIAAMLNLMVALGALELAKAGDERTPAAPTTHPLADRGLRAVLPARLRWAALTALGLGGVLSLGLEVVYVHMLAIVAGNSVYAFGLMVATFLVGLSLGGEGARRMLLVPNVHPATVLVIMLLGLCLSVALGGLLWNGIPDYFASYAVYPAARAFGAREVIRGLVCCGVMIPPTLFIGASYVVAMDIVTASSSGENSVALGWGAAINTLGNIIGVLLFGFVLLPSLGGLEAGRAIGWSALVLAIAVMLMAGRLRLPVLAGTGIAFGVLLLTSRVALDYDSLSTGANVYFQAQRWGKVIDHADSIDGGLTTVVRQPAPTGDVHTLLTNGKFQGNDSMAGEMQAQVGFALAPLLHQERRDRALVIGYGTGVTTRVFHEAGFKQVEVAELSGDIVRLADQHFAKVNRLASQGPGVTMRITDGRNLLLLTRDRYDVISLEISSIWFAGAASLYNQEFYQLARARMQPDGVLQQWMQLHHLSGMDLLHIMATLRSEFQYVSLYLMGSQGILVATNSANKAAANPVAMQALRGSPSLADALRIAGRTPESLAQDIFLRAPSVDRFLNEVGIEPRLWISTDDNLRLEYDTPRGNVNDAARSFAANRALLERFR